MKTKLSLISPCYQEAPVIEDFYRAAKAVLQQVPAVEHEMILVDDGSGDQTPEILKKLAAENPTVKVIILSRNFGHQTALTAGIDHACGDAVIMMDSDLQHPVELILPMVDAWQQGYDVVSTIRCETQGVGVFKKLTSKAFYLLFNRLSQTALPMGAADFCLLARPVYTQLKAMRERHRFLRGLVCWLGFRRMLIPYSANPRRAGVSKYSLPKMLRLASTAVFSFSSKPLTLAIRIGLFLTAAGCLYLTYILYGFFVTKDLVPGWASLICTLLILNGFQLIFVGLIGEYIAKIFEEVKGRPLYVIKEQVNLESSL